jgi:hypothetical protein
MVLYVVKILAVGGQRAFDYVLSINTYFAISKIPGSLLKIL